MRCLDFFLRLIAKNAHTLFLLDFFKSVQNLISSHSVSMTIEERDDPVRSQSDSRKFLAAKMDRANRVVATSPADRRQSLAVLFHF